MLWSVEHRAYGQIECLRTGNCKYHKQFSFELLPECGEIASCCHSKQFVIDVRKLVGHLTFVHQLDLFLSDSCHCLDSPSLNAYSSLVAVSSYEIDLLTMGVSLCAAVAVTLVEWLLAVSE